MKVYNNLCLICAVAILVGMNMLVSGQKVFDHSLPANGLIALSNDVQIPKISAGYTLWLPEFKQPKGVLVFFNGRRDTTLSDPLIEASLRSNLAILFVTTNNRVEFLFETHKMRELEGYIHEVVKRYNLESKNLMFCGMSLAGTRALKMSVFAHSKDSKYHYVPKAVAICDAPLDMVRFHKEGQKARDLNFHQVAANEGSWVSAYLEKGLGGSPKDRLQQFMDYSPYCYFDESELKYKAFEHTHIRAYTEPDVNWWMKTRRKDYYGMNSIDLAGFVNEVNILGNENAALITSQNKGFLNNGERHPHSWSIVDEEELIEWFVNIIE